MRKACGRGRQEISFEHVKFLVSDVGDNNRTCLMITVRIKLVSICKH